MFQTTNKIESNKNVNLIGIQRQKSSFESSNMRRASMLDQFTKNFSVFETDLNDSDNTEAYMPDRSVHLPSTKGIVNASLKKPISYDRKTPDTTFKYSNKKLNKSYHLICKRNDSKSVLQILPSFEVEQASRTSIPLSYI